MIYLGAEKRIPTFCEKPISLNLSITDPVLEAVATSGIQLQIGFQRRFDKGFIEIQRRVQSGSLGRIYTARLCTHDPEPPPAGYLNTSGGIFADMLIHDFDLLRWATGQEIAQVYATGGALTGDPMFEAANDIDTAAIIATLEDGAVSVITGSRHNPLGHDVRLEVFGARDSLVSGVDGQSPLHLIGVGDSSDAGESGNRPMHGDFLSRFGEAYQAELRAFIGVALEGTQVAVNGEDAREALRAAAAAHLSFTGRRPVDMTEIT
jgi:myo-inositol 2-dehydrogenase/D-chiro-inositol 1-dehydrogenase